MFESLTIKDAKSNLGNWCKVLRKGASLSQQELADELGISRLTISKLENGENFTIETLLKILQHFNQMNALNDYVIRQSETPESLY